jgi:hypothetical protein
LSESLIGPLRRSEIFIESLKAALEPNKIFIPFEDINNQVHYIPITKIKELSPAILFPLEYVDKKPVKPVRFINGKIFPLSTGQLNFFRLAAWLCINVENGTIVLMDEPDIFLHPSLITQLCNLLYTILTNTGARGIIATHSPYFVREVPKRKVLIFKENIEGSISINNPFLNTIGADIGEISYFVFDETYYGSYIEMAKNYLLSSNAIDVDNRILDLKSSLSLPALIYLKKALSVDL